MSFSLFGQIAPRTTGAIIRHLMPANLKRLVVYLRPIDMRWGPTKLRSLCRDELRLEPDRYGLKTLDF